MLRFYQCLLQGPRGVSIARAGEGVGNETLHAELALVMAFLDDCEHQKCCQPQFMHL